MKDILVIKASGRKEPYSQEKLKHSLEKARVSPIVAEPSRWLRADSVQYSRCMGLHAVSWDYPPGKSLPALIERAGLQPITALTRLTRSQKRQLTGKGVILCTDLDQRTLREVGITPENTANVLEEAEKLCQRA